MGIDETKASNLSWKCVKVWSYGDGMETGFATMIMKSFNNERTFTRTCICTANTVNIHIYTKSYRRAIKSAVCSLHCNPTRVFGYSALHNTALFQSWYAQSEFIIY